MIDIDYYVNQLQKEKCVIYLFHGVVERSQYDVRNYTRKHLEKDEFRKLMKGLKAKGHALSMDEIVEHHSLEKEFPDFSYVVTFDDGFENNFSVAAPILYDLKIACIFYVSTELIEKNSMTWIDRIEYCIENTESGDLSLDWKRAPVCFDSVESKIALLDGLRRTVKTTAEIDTDVLVEKIYDQCKMELIIESEDPLDKKMSWKQVGALHNEALFVVGGHSHHHVNMAFLREPELEMEISTSLFLLRRQAGVETKHYAYPEGLSHCFSDQVIRKLKDHLIICCPTAIEGINDKDTDLFHLKRLMVN